MMVVVMGEMAAALHLNETLRANTRSCQMFLLRQRGTGAENECVRVIRLARAGAASILSAGLCLGAGRLYAASSVELQAPRAAVPVEQRVDINHASLDELLKVPGLSRVWAARIVRFRPYRTKDDLLDKGVVSSAVYDRIKDFVIAHHDKPH